MNAYKRQTSIDCYHQIKAEGLLSKMRMMYFEAVYENSPCTGAEAFDAIERAGKLTKKSSRLERTRFTELRDMGVIKEVGTRPCKISGRNALVFDLTDNLPTKLEPVSTKKQRRETAVNALRELYKNKDTATDSDWVEVAELIKKI